jgi:N-acetylglucosamine-6-sulfatase
MQGPRPNFVVIIADDMAYGLFGQGKRFPFLPLPNLEALAARGAQFDHAFVTTSLCSPSRATMLSGLYAHSNGVFKNEGGTDLPPNIVTYPQVLQHGGYKTAFIGKWHMDGSTDAPRPGFDYWVSFKGQGVYRDPLLNENGREVQRTGYITDLLTGYAVDWIHQQSASDPFLLILSHKAPHGPWEPAPRHANALADAQIPEPLSFEDSYEDKPAWQRRYARCGGMASAYKDCPDPLPSMIPHWPWAAQDPGRLDYMRTLLALDESVGSVVKALQDQGVAGSTYVVFLSDNGFFLGEHRLSDKRLAYEESLRVPLVMAGPEVPPRRNSAMVLNLDLAPTVIDLAGLPVPSEMQGRSLAQLLRGQVASVRDSFLYEYDAEVPFPVIPSIFAIRTAGRKYVSYPDHPADEELYDLGIDPTEMTNVAGHPEWKAIRDDLRQRLDRLLEQTGAQPMPN